MAQQFRDTTGTTLVSDGRIVGLHSYAEGTNLATDQFRWQEQIKFKECQLPNRPKSHVAPFAIQ